MNEGKGDGEGAGPYNPIASMVQKINKNYIYMAIEAIEVQGSTPYPSSSFSLSFSPFSSSYI